MVDVPSEIPFEKTDFPFLSRYQLQIVPSFEIGVLNSLPNKDFLLREAVSVHCLLVICTFVLGDW